MRLLVTDLPRIGSGFCAVAREVMGHRGLSIPWVAVCTGFTEVRLLVSSCCHMTSPLGESGESGCFCTLITNGTVLIFSAFVSGGKNLKEAGIGFLFFCLFTFYLWQFFFFFFKQVSSLLEIYSIWLGTS